MTYFVIWKSITVGIWGRFKACLLYQFKRMYALSRTWLSKSRNLVMVNTTLIVRKILIEIHLQNAKIDSKKCLLIFPRKAKKIKLLLYIYQITVFSTKACALLFNNFWSKTLYFLHSVKFTGLLHRHFYQIPYFYQRNVLQKH